MSNTQKNKHTEQSILNKSFNETYDVLSVETLEYDPSGVMRSKVTNNLATRLDDTADPVLYLGKSPIGSSTSDPVWQIKKVDTTSGVVITWADGNADFDNIWDNRTSLTYN